MADNTKYNFNGKYNLGKRNLAFEIINKYLDDNKYKSYQELKLIFNFKASNGQEVIYDENDYNHWSKNLNQNSSSKRYSNYISHNDEKIYISTQWGIESIQPLIKLAKDKFRYDIETINNTLVDITTLQIDNLINTKNIILYGAPGVGKTHNYQKLITMIEKGSKESDIFKTITNNQTNEQTELNEDDFKNIQNDKRVEFVTFHQSYSYEDFIEGFRPQENGNIELEDGIFKKLSLEAINQSKQVINKQITFEDAFSILRTEFIDEELETLHTVRQNEIVIKNFQEKSMQVKTIDAKNWQYIKKSDLETVVNAILDNTVTKPVDVKKLNVKKDTMSLAGYYFPIGTKIVDIIKSNKVDEVEQKNFYIVIDEINRGNISKIFGELITLIEESKRDNYEITLPYSKKPFKVPSNLYIIATMNSTDKSIATIDIALRRRFTFLKMKPNPNLVKDEEAREFMEKLNIYIQNSVGEDYMLGHSYFMGDDVDFEFIKEYKIKPLLEEYFYSDDKTPDDIIKEALEKL